RARRIAPRHVQRRSAVARALRRSRGPMADRQRRLHRDAVEGRRRAGCVAEGAPHGRYVRSLRAGANGMRSPTRIRAPVSLAVLLAGALAHAAAQAPPNAANTEPASPRVEDPFGRATPRDTVSGF